MRLKQEIIVCSSIFHRIACRTLTGIWHYYFITESLSRYENLLLLFTSLVRRVIVTRENFRLPTNEKRDTLRKKGDFPLQSSFLLYSSRRDASFIFASKTLKLSLPKLQSHSLRHRHHAIMQGGVSQVIVYVEIERSVLYSEVEA